MRNLLPIHFLTVLLLTGVPGRASAASPSACDSLSALVLPHTRITSAQMVPAGDFTPPSATGAPANSANYKGMPAFCRVVVEAMPTPDSDIKIEVWMPAAGWNGKFQGEGNGGFAGVIGYSAMAVAVKRGYATAGTDTGHTGTGLEAGWALGHPEKVIDFGYRGIHEMTLNAKAIIQAFYRTKPQHSYFPSCSDGGREALMEAQRYPEDYDGIIAGAPANYWTHHFTAITAAELAIAAPASYIPASKLPAINAAVLAACDARDGLADGLISNPSRCDFDPATLLCQGTDSDSCLTAPQVTALKAIYAGPHDAKGHAIFPGFSPGDEEGWSAWILGNGPRHGLLFTFGVQYFGNMVYEKPDWDYQTFNVEQAVKRADDKTAHALNSNDPNLRRFRERGGKLIMYQGWSDPAVPALNTINYDQAVVKTLGQRDADSFLRLFMAPGMEHCGGGPGPNYFGQNGNAREDDPEHNIYAAIEQWVEKGVAPSQIIATKYVNDSKPAEGVKMTRPLCPYPQVAKYKGSGDTNDAANFVCSPENK